MGRADGIFFRDINSVELPTNGTTFRHVEDANTSSIHLTATDSGLQLQNEELEDEFTKSFIFESPSESSTWLVGYPLPPVRRAPCSRVHLPPDVCLIFDYFSASPPPSPLWGPPPPVIRLQPVHGMSSPCLDGVSCPLLRLERDS